jgi:hypothetical protein
MRKQQAENGIEEVLGEPAQTRRQGVIELPAGEAREQLVPSWLRPCLTRRRRRSVTGSLSTHGGSHPAHPIWSVRVGPAILLQPVRRSYR